MKCDQYLISGNSKDECSFLLSLSLSLSLLLFLSLSLSRSLSLMVEAVACALDLCMNACDWLAAGQAASGMG